MDRIQTIPTIPSKGCIVVPKNARVRIAQQCGGSGTLTVYTSYTVDLDSGGF
jgi:hypothetical protein